MCHQDHPQEQPAGRQCLPRVEQERASSSWGHCAPTYHPRVRAAWRPEVLLHHHGAYCRRQSVWQNQKHACLLGKSGRQCRQVIMSSLELYAPKEYHASWSEARKSSLWAKLRWLNYSEAHWFRLCDLFPVGPTWDTLPWQPPLYVAWALLRSVLW